MALRRTLGKILQPILFYNHDDDKYYYGNYKGSFNLLRIFSWIISHPGRLYNLFKFGQLFKFNSYRRFKFKRALQNYSRNFKNNNNYNKKNLINKFDYFCENGGVILDNYFKEDIIDNFLVKYKLVFEDFNDLKNTKSKFNLCKHTYLPLTDELNDLWLDSTILKFIKTAFGKKFGDKIYARNYPTALFTSICDDSIGSRFRYKNKSAGLKDSHMGADCWHPDHSVMLNVHILLDDLNEDDPHMEFIPSKNNYLTMKHCYSDETIDKLNIKPIKCIGKKGTVYIHAGSTIHRLKLKKGTRRVLHFEFTAGSNILYHSPNLIKCLDNEYDLEKINQDKREVLRGIFPETLFKGYEINGNVVQPTKFKGI